MTQEQDSELTAWARKAFGIAATTGRDRALFVAATIGRQAVRMGVDPDDVSKWLQTAYCSVWVRMSDLNPGADLRGIRTVIQKAMSSRAE